MAESTVVKQLIILKGSLADVLWWGTGSGSGSGYGVGLGYNFSYGASYGTIFVGVDGSGGSS